MTLRKRRILQETLALSRSIGDRPRWGVRVRTYRGIDTTKIQGEHK